MEQEHGGQGGAMIAGQASHLRSLHRHSGSSSAVTGSGPSSSPRPGPHSLTPGAGSISSPISASGHLGPSAFTSASASTPAAGPSSLHRSTKSVGRASLPFSFPPLFFQPNPSSTSLVPSTAEGRPIPLDDSTAAHRTSALRELNSNFPSPVSRHRYAKTSGAASSTHAQPVIVRTYSGPSAAGPAPLSTTQSYYYRPASSIRKGPRRTPLAAGPASSSTSFSPAIDKPTAGATRHEGFLSMARSRAQKKMPWQWGAPGAQQQDPTKLPPVEAFTYRGLMAGLEDQSGRSDIGADLDRIAEICARSRYSLSNQYEVHVVPHGSGAAFVTSNSSSGSRRKGHGRSGSSSSSSSRKDMPNGLTLQAVQSDDDEGASSHTPRKRRGAPRRRSAAYGTLETIMSSSRSSEEDKTKKKSAQEIAEEVRARAARRQSPTASGSGSSGNGAINKTDDNACDDIPRQQQGQQGRPDHPTERNNVRKKSMSFATAFIDSRNAKGDSTSPRGPATALVSEPALPQTSNSHLEIRTAPGVPGEALGDVYSQEIVEPGTPVSSAGSEPTLTENLTHLEDMQTPPSGGGLLSGLSRWMPWGANGPDSSLGGVPGDAEGSLRDILKTTRGKPNKGEGVDLGE